jgi:hypothetical protein
MCSITSGVLNMIIGVGDRNIVNISTQYVVITISDLNAANLLQFSFQGVSHLIIWGRLQWVGGVRKCGATLWSIVAITMLHWGTTSSGIGAQHFSFLLKCWREQHIVEFSFVRPPRRWKLLRISCLFLRFYGASETPSLGTTLPFQLEQLRVKCWSASDASLSLLLIVKSLSWIGWNI